MIVSIDPGKNHTAWALWISSGRLVAAGLARNPLAHKKGYTAPEVWSGCASEVIRQISRVPESSKDLDGPIGLVCERPKVRKLSNEDPNDLLDLTGVLGCIIQGLKVTRGCLCVWAPLPEEWKGQLPKTVTQERVNAALSEEEKKSILPCPEGLSHNIYDAIHLGIVHFERMGIHRVTKINTRAVNTATRP